MSIVSVPFLFLFMPAVIGVYHLIPEKKGLQLRNVFLLLASLFFYTWGEPLFVLLLAGMVILTWCFGKMAHGNKGNRTGKTAVALTAISNLLLLLIFAGLLKSGTMTELPIGFSFFAFASISYVVDIYRGQFESGVSILNTALYTCIFFKILQGPIITYRKFEPQLSDRQNSFDLVAEGIWRFSLGLCKKIIIADNLYFIVEEILSSDFEGLTAGDAWLGCITFLVYLYFDFSGYSDMAIGLAKCFGFTIPENFNYPYISKSIAEFWRRWHITLCAWFTEYIFYPVLLGPSVRFRKMLLRRKVNGQVAKGLQNFIVLASVWLTVALWHGITLNFLLWGMINCLGMLLEQHIKPIGNKCVNSVVRHAGLLLFLFISMPLISIESFGDALLFYKGMFAGGLGITVTNVYYIRRYGMLLLVGIIGCLPVIPFIKEKFIHLGGGDYQKLWDICAAVVMILLVIISLYYLFTRDSVVFLYQQ